MNTNFLRSLFFLFIFLLAVYGVIYVIAKYRPVQKEISGKCTVYNSELTAVCVMNDGRKQLFVKWDGGK